MPYTPVRKIRVLITDDSSFMRMAIRGILNQDPGIEIVGTAANGSEAVARARELRPDVITMDVEMPVMDGISAVREIMSRIPTSIIMISTLTCEGASATFDALDAGAIDFIAKDMGGLPETREAFQRELLIKVNAAAAGIKRSVTPSSGTACEPRTKATIAPGSRKISAVVIGASTGGPQAVQEVLSHIPADFPYAIIAAIHMPKAFTGPYARRLNDKCLLEVKEGEDGDSLEAGRVLIAQGGVHSKVEREGGKYILRVRPIACFPEQIYIPSVDILMASCADACSGALLGVILTGMGNDGFKGMQRLKQCGGVTVVQDEATSTIFGMPRACISGGVADQILPLSEIGNALRKFSCA